MNIEKNFSEAIRDIPTLTELCTLAIYNVAVSWPFMAHVHSHHNILTLKDFFRRKANFLQSIINDPSIWIGDTVSHENGCLDGTEWDDWAIRLFSAIEKLKPVLTNLHESVIAFVQGTLGTFVKRFSEEFKEGGEIDELTDEELNELDFSLTNDVNKGGLGSWQCGQSRQPAESLLKFNASFMGVQNQTAGFISHKLTEDEDHTYLMRKARERDESGHQKALKLAQIRADEEKIQENRKTEAQRGEKRDKKASMLIKTTKNLSLSDTDVDGLNNEELNQQLDCHHEIKKHQAADSSGNGVAIIGNSEATECVPLKSHMKLKAD